MRLLLAILWHLNLSLFALETDLNFPETSLKVKSDRPNIILILVDDMGYGDASCYGGTLIDTPNLDALAQNGILCTNAYSPSPVCGPSRVGILTGKYPSRSGVYWNPDMGAVSIPKDELLISQQLSKAGYSTALIGKWNLNNPQWDPMPAKDYFDYTNHVICWEADYWPDSSGHYLGVNDKSLKSSKTNNLWGPKNEGDLYLTDLMTADACAYIERESKGNKPFFLYLAYNAPHSPLQGKAEHLEKLSHINSEALKVYASMLISIDEGTGKIIQTLKNNGITENTLVIFLSDNGPARTNFKGLPESWPKDQILGSKNDLNGQKGNYFEGGIRVPLLISWPHMLEKNRHYDKPIYALDLYPAICSAANIDVNSNLDGINVLPYLNKNQNPDQRSAMLWCGSIWNPKRTGAIRIEDWKLILNSNSKDFLFNLKEDPKETNNLIDQEPEKYQTIRSKFLEMTIDMPDPITPRKNLKQANKRTNHRNE